MSRSARTASDRLADLLRNERLALAEFLVALSEFDRDRGWAALGYTSLFHYLQRELRLTSGPAFYRMTAARLIQEFPEVVEPLRDGRLCLMTLGEVAKVLTRDNLAAVLPRFFAASKQDAKEIAAELSPQPVPIRTVVTPVLSLAPTPLAGARRLFIAAHPGTTELPSPTVLPVEIPPVAEPLLCVSGPTVIEPRTAELSRMHITVSRRLLEKLAAARDLLSHARPDATDDEIIETGLDLVIAGAAKRRGIGNRTAARKRRTNPGRDSDSDPDRHPGPDPAPTATASTTRTPIPARHRPHIPADVRRAVWTRDAGRCQFRLASGEICGSTRQLEFHHLTAFALGGGSSADELELRCKPHNLHEARQVFGDELMERYTRVRGPRPEAARGARTLAAVRGPGLGRPEASRP